MANITIKESVISDGEPMTSGLITDPRRPLEWPTRCFYKLIVYIGNIGGNKKSKINVCNNFYPSSLPPFQDTHDLALNNEQILTHSSKRFAITDLNFFKFWFIRC